MAIPTRAKLDRPTLIIDLGNALVKYRIGAIENVFPHALAVINETQYKEGLQRAGSLGGAFNFIQLGKSYYAVGDSAAAYMVERRQGRTKYTEDYYGPFMLSIIARNFSTAEAAAILENGIDVMASHAPLDAIFSDTLISALKGTWEFNAGGKAFKLKVASAITFDEPFGGYNLLALVPGKNLGAWKYPLYGLTVGMLDMGGGTISATKLGPDGAILKARNTLTGINDFMIAFEAELIMNKESSAYLGLMRSVLPAILRDALKTGMLKVKGDPLGINVEKQIQAAGVVILNELSNLYLNVLDNGADLDVVGLTGGGMGSFERETRRIIKHNDIRMAAPAADIHFANIRGAANLLAALKPQGI